MKSQPTKICTKCHEEKALNEFGKNKTRKNGHTHHCKQCNKIIDKFRQKNPNKMREKRKRSSMRISNNYVKRLLQKTFGLKFSEIPSFLIAEKREQIQLLRFVRNFERKYL